MAVPAVYYFGRDDLPIILLTAYAKSEKGNLSKSEQNSLSALVKRLVETYGAGHE